MLRSVSPPVHLHVGKKTPVHLHIKPGNKGLTKSERQQLSCSEMSAGRPSVRASGSFNAAHCSRAGHWGNQASSSRTPWVPPPAKASRQKMAWEGASHRLEIHPDPSHSTVLHLSDLSGDEDSTDLLIKREESDVYENKVKSLRAEMNQLKAEVDLHKSIRDLEEKEAALQNSMSSLKRKEAELSYCQEELLQSEMDNAILKRSLSRSASPSRPRSAMDGEEKRKRECLLAQLAAVEAEGMSVMSHAKKLKGSIKKLQKDRRFVSVHASEVAESKDVFLESLSQFEKSNKALSRLIQAQQAHQASVGYLTEHRDLLEQKLTMSQSTNQVLKERLEEQEKIARHTNELHDEIGQKEGEIHTLNIRIESLREQLHCKDVECSQMQGEVLELKKFHQQDKEHLKKATKQHKDRAMQSERTLESVGVQLEEANVEFSKVKTRLVKSNQELLVNEAEIAALKMKIHELETCLSQSQMTAKVSLDVTSSQLSERSHELATARMEVERLKANIATIESSQRSAESCNLNKISGLESELSQLSSSLSHYQGLSAEYKVQLERVRADQETVTKELHIKEQEIDHLKRENLIEAEKHRLKYQQRLSEFEPMPEMLKTTEQRLSDAQERLLTHEHQSGEQSRLIAELSLKAEQQCAGMDSLKDKLHEAVMERRSLESKLVSAEQKKQDLEQQNRELLSTSGRKEEMVQRLQSRVEELVHEMALLSAQVDSAKADGRKQVEQAKERASNKERASVSRISDLETQLTRANNLATQFRKSKDDLERRYHSRVHELQDRLEQANSTKRSLENYVSFLKSSYATVFSDSGSHHVPGASISPLTH